jgi:hypothetical protein
VSFIEKGEIKMDKILQKLDGMIKVEKAVDTGHHTAYDDHGNYFEEGVKVGRLEVLEELFDHLGSDVVSTVKQQLLVAGMKADEFDTWASDLYVLVTPISEKWLKTYKHKSYVKIFRSKMDGRRWYDIPFGNMDDYIKSKSK